MRIVKNISFFIILGFIVVLISIWIKSDFLFSYLQNSIIGLLLTLLAINTATLGLIASKMQDMLEKHVGLSFEKTIKEMKFSLIEQIVLIAVSITSLMLLGSSIIIFEYKEILVNSLLTSVLLYAIHILWDTGKAVFVIIDLIQKNKGS